MLGRMMTGANDRAGAKGTRTDFIDARASSFHAQKSKPVESRPISKTKISLALMNDFDIVAVGIEHPCRIIARITSVRLKVGH